jgi:hypothetical protein
MFVKEHSSMVLFDPFLSTFGVAFYVPMWSSWISLLPCYSFLLIEAVVESTVLRFEASSFQSPRVRKKASARWVAVAVMSEKL